jgi:hypothetical protein
MRRSIVLSTGTTSSLHIVRLGSTYSVRYSYAMVTTSLLSMVVHVSGLRPASRVARSRRPGGETDRVSLIADGTGQLADHVDGRSLHVPQ